MSSPFDLPTTCYNPGAFIRTGIDLLALASEPEVARLWAHPSALEGMSVGAVAAHGLRMLDEISTTASGPSQRRRDSGASLNTRERPDWTSARI
jgi:hypothetical protein